jgi:GGDEF domain-containing protein
MPGGPHSGSEIWDAPDREIAKPGENRSDSLGVAALPAHGTTAVELLAAADGALFKAKEEGRDRVLVAEVSLNR